MPSKPQITWTKNYDLFVLCDFNRNVDNVDRLKALMAREGYIPAHPLHVVRVDGKLHIKDGHHRFTAARELGIAVPYVVCTDNATIFELQGATKAWTMRDYLAAYVRLGSGDYIELERFVDSTGISLQLAAAMMFGYSAARTGCIHKVFKEGKFRVKDRQHAASVARVIKAFEAAGIEWAKTAWLVGAVSRALRADGVDIDRMCAKIKTFSQFVEKQPNQERYLEMLEDIYNRAARDRFPLQFMADKAASSRAVTANSPENDKRRMDGNQRKGYRVHVPAMPLAAAPSRMN